MRNEINIKHPTLYSIPADMTYAMVNERPINKRHIYCHPQSYILGASDVGLATGFMGALAGAVVAGGVVMTPWIGAGVLGAGVVGTKPGDGTGTGAGVVIPVVEEGDVDDGMEVPAVVEPVLQQNAAAIATSV